MEGPLRILSTVLRLEQHYRFCCTRDNHDVLHSYLAKSVKDAACKGGFTNEMSLAHATKLLSGLVDRIRGLVEDATIEGCEHGAEIRRIRIKGRDLLFFVRGSGKHKRILEVETARRAPQPYANRRRHPRQGRRHLFL